MPRKNNWFTTTNSTGWFPCWFPFTLLVSLDGSQVPLGLPLPEPRLPKTSGRSKQGLAALEALATRLKVGAHFS